MPIANSTLVLPHFFEGAREGSDAPQKRTFLARSVEWFFRNLLIIKSFLFSAKGRSRQECEQRSHFG